ncbi:MAG TPA: carboxypeptidase regulatory-like domain-containing protein [Bacteroidia bacterium]|nr:carboxypeptidase regulatory-like domain-containing protein [Bacteroidia bacterium]
MRICKSAAIFSLICIISVSVSAQKKQNSTTSKSKDSYRKLFTDANEMAGENYTDSALHTFLYLYSLDTSNANVAYNIGMLYLQTSAHKAEGLPYLEKAAKKVTPKYIPDDPYEKSAPPPTYYYLARAQHLNYQFDNAIENFNKFKKLLNKKDSRQDDIDYWIQCCNNGKILIQSPVDCKVINIGDSINSKYPDYCPVLTADEQQLLFTSKRPYGDSLKDIYGNYFEDIWISYAKKSGGWTTAKNIGAPVNTSGNEATSSISPDGQILIAYKDDEQGDGNLFVSYNRGSKWTYPALIDSANTGVVNTTSQEKSACLSPDAQTLYFVSDRPGGLGGLDIYKIALQDNGKWANPVNLGPTINTKYDEEAPYIHPDDSTMFFSSKGHNSMGGYDVFTTRLNKQGQFDEPKNMGAPINTPDDDIYFTLSADGRRAYYSSVRPGGYGENDIYEVLFNVPIKVQPVAVLVGYIRTPDGSPIPTDVLVTTGLVKGDTTRLKTKVNPRTGKFLQVLRPNDTYRVVISAQGKKVYDQDFFLPADSSYINLSRSFFRTNITLGDTTNVLEGRKKVAPVVASAAKKDMPGQILDENKKPAPSLTVQLVNDKDSVIATTVTDKDGYFTFRQLAAGSNNLLKVDASDSQLKKNKVLYLADKDERIVRNDDNKKKNIFYFGNLPLDLGSLEALAVNDPDRKSKQSKYSKDTASMPKSDADFTRYFAYNIDKVNTSDADFMTFIDKVAAKAGNGAVTVSISGSASKVPTGNIFKRSNNVLAGRRASDCQWKIEKALKEKKVDMSKITFTSDHSVNGPKYDGDAADQVKYETFQFVKVYIK